MSPAAHRLPRAALAATICVALLVPFALLGCDREQGEPIGDPVSVRLGVSKESMSALAYIARDEGIFERSGLDVEFIEYSSSQLALEALLAGEVDASLSADTPIVLSALDGRPVTIVCTVGTHANDIKIVARADQGVRAPEDLRGKRVGTREGTAAHFFLHSYLIMHGMRESETRMRFDGFSEITQALIDGELDAVAIRQPFIAELQQSLGDQCVILEAEGLYEKTMNLCVADGDGAASQEARLRLVRALLAAEEVATGSDAGRTRQEIADAIGVTEEDLCPCLIAPGVVGLRQSLLLTLEDQARWARDSTDDHDDRIDFLSCLDPTALLEAAPERVTVVR